MFNSVDLLQLATAMLQGHPLLNRAIFCPFRRPLPRGQRAQVFLSKLSKTSEWVSSVLRPHQHSGGGASPGYTGDGFYRSKDPTNSIKVLKEMLQKRKKTTKTT